MNAGRRVDTHVFTHHTQQTAHSAARAAETAAPEWAAAVYSSQGRGPSHPCPPLRTFKRPVYKLKRTVTVGSSRTGQRKQSLGEDAGSRKRRW